MNAILVAVTAALLFYFDSTAAAAVGCLLGGAIVIVNLWVLSLLGAAILRPPAPASPALPPNLV